MTTLHIDKPMDETELLRMPAKDYMNTAQLQFFRERLLTLKNKLSQNVTTTTEHLRSAEVVADPSDRATQEEEHGIELRTRDRERNLSRKIDQALARIDDGSYGYCVDTGEPIGLKRLLARPTATLSLDAQERKEKLERIYAA